MKRMFAILVVVALLVSLAACASSGAETSNPGDTSEHYIDAIGTESMEAANPSKGGESVNNGGSTSNTGSDIATSDHSGSSTGGSDDGNSSTGNGSTTPSNPQPQPTNPQPTNPQPQPTNPQPSNPQPQPTNPQPTNPQPQPTNPQPTNPQPTNPQPTEPKPTNPQPTNPQPTNPQPTEPKPTEPVHVHNYTKKVTKPTCTEGGYTTYTCSCGYSYQSDNTPATGHSYGVSSSVPATCTAEGSKTYKCSNCGDTYSETIPMTDHDWQHNHTDAITHEVIYLHCHCGWECTEAEAEAHGMDIGTYYMLFHVKQYIDQGIANGHSYYWRTETVVDSPAVDEWVCKMCGKSTTTQP